MTWPTSQDYNEAVQYSGNFFDPDLQRGEVVVNALGLPVHAPAVLPTFINSKAAMARRGHSSASGKVPGLRERYAKIDEHLAKAKLPFAVGFQFFQEGIQVKGERFPLLKMEWVEGLALNEFVAQNLIKPHYLHALLQMWAKLTARLRDAKLLMLICSMAMCFWYPADAAETWAQAH